MHARSGVEKMTFENNPDATFSHLLELAFLKSEATCLELLPRPTALKTISWRPRGRPCLLLCFFAGLIDRYDAESEGSGRLAGKATFLEKGIHFSSTWKCFDRAP
jgi:hypothetical protein